MRSLQARLSAAFLGIAVLTTVLSATLATYTAHRTFRQYVEHRTDVTRFPPPPFDPSGRANPAPPPGTPAPLPPGARLRPFGVRERLFSSRLRNAIWGGTLAAAGVGVLVALWLARRIVKPVSELTRATRAIEGGLPAPPVPVQGHDEIADLTRAFNRMAAHLAEDDERRRRLFAGIVHELRTPLSVIQGTLEGVLDRVIEPTPERIAGLHSQTVLLKRLITDLRDLSLAQAGQLQLHLETIDIAGVVRDSVEGLAPLLEERGVSLRVEAPDCLPPVEADPDRLRQVVQNLVENAVRHTPQGGNVHIVLVEDAGGVRLAVSDTGTGIPAGDLPHIFEHFYRTDQSRARSSGGSGLGLAIVKSLVEAHRGRVAVESTPGAGSIFTVTLPLRAGEGT